jgi:hypothetical protein
MIQCSVLVQCFGPVAALATWLPAIWTSPKGLVYGTNNSSFYSISTIALLIQIQGKNKRLVTWKKRGKYFATLW